MTDEPEELPEEVGDPIELDLSWEENEDDIDIVIEYGEARIHLNHTWGDGAHHAALLIQALPQALAAVEQQLNPPEESP